MSEINMVTEVETGTASQERKSSHLDILVRLPNLFPKFKTWLFLMDGEVPSVKEPSSYMAWEILQS